MTDEEKLSQDQKDDARLLVIFLVVALAAVFAAPMQWPTVAEGAIAIADGYLFVVLVLAALRTDHGVDFKNRNLWVTAWFPRRTAGLFLIFLLLVTIVGGFASLYTGTQVFKTEKSWLDAVYISFQTLGFSDFGPEAGYGQRVVIAELASGVLLMIGAFPLLVSRMSTFESS